MAQRRLVQNACNMFHIKYHSFIQYTASVVIMTQAILFDLIHIMTAFVNSLDAFFFSNKNKNHYSPYTHLGVYFACQCLKSGKEE
jgi:hypothetical protein